MNLSKRYRILAASAILAFAAFPSCKEHSPDLPLPDTYTPTLFVGNNNQFVYALDPVSGEEKWKLHLSGEVHATPVLYGGFIWVASKNGTLYKIEKQQGKILAEKDFGAEIIGTPYGYDRYLLVPAGNSLNALDVTDMDVKWTQDIGAPIKASPTSHTVNHIDKVDYPVIFIAGTNNKVYALRNDGSIIWQHAPAENGSFFSSPCVVNDSFLYIGNDNGIMYALHTVDGSLKWKFTTGGMIKSSPIQVGGNVLFGSHDRNFYSVDSASGQLRWKVPTSDVVQSSPSFFNQNVYFGSHDQNMYCVDIINGNVKWKMRTFGMISSSPLIYRGDIYFGSYDKNMYRLDANTGQQKFTFNINGQMFCSPIIDSVGGAAVPSISGSYRY